MSTQLSSGSGLSGLPLSLVSTEASVYWRELVEECSECLSIDTGSRIGECWRCLMTVRGGSAERLPRLTWGVSSAQGPKAWATTSDCVRQAWARRWQVER